MRARFVLWFLVLSVVMIIVGGTAMSESMYNEILLPVAIVLVCVVLVVLRVFNGRIAAAMSSHLGVQISARNLPSIRSPARFYRDVEVLKGTRAMTERSFLGGFIKVRKPRSNPLD
jgi:hypothetical protein